MLIIGFILRLKHIDEQLLGFVPVKTIISIFVVLLIDLGYLLAQQTSLHKGGILYSLLLFFLFAEAAWTLATDASSHLENI
jgi:flagellar biosynthesis protein FliQ